MGTKVTVVEYMNRIVPVEDNEISKELEKSLKKKGILILTSSEVKNATVNDDGNVDVVIESKNGESKTINSEIVLSAVGIKTNIENIGLEDLGIKTEKDKILVDDFYMTNLKDYYAIGDVVKGQALAHVASAEEYYALKKLLDMMLIHWIITIFLVVHIVVQKSPLDIQKNKQSKMDMKLKLVNSHFQHRKSTSFREK